MVPTFRNTLRAANKFQHLEVEAKWSKARAYGRFDWLIDLGLNVAGYVKERRSHGRSTVEQRF